MKLAFVSFSSKELMVFGLQMLLRMESFEELERIFEN